MHIWSINFGKGAKNIQQGKDNVLINGVGKMDNHMQKNKIRPQSYIEHKN